MNDEELAKPEQWHLKREINIVHIFATISIIISAIWYLGGLDKRIMTNTQSIEFMQKQRSEDQQRIEKQLDSINKKLDRLLDK
ncbi:MAG: hypothetical protein HRU25_11890 [Psychrobium sp.]|nr:hypothetical protein [Psychrobium sp.]